MSKFFFGHVEVVVTLWEHQLLYIKVLFVMIITRWCFSVYFWGDGLLNLLFTAVDIAETSAEL